MKTRGIIYISGKVTDVPERELYQKFHDTEAMLSRQGFQVVNPLKIITRWADGIRWQSGLQVCLNALNDCTAIYMMPCATECEVSQIELDKAMKLNYKIYYELENIEVNEPTKIVHCKEQKL